MACACCFSSSEGARHLHAPALAAPAGVDLGLDDPDRPAELPARFHGLVQREAGHAARGRHPEPAQDLLGLVFVDLHCETGGLGWGRDPATESGPAGRASSIPQHVAGVRAALPAGLAARRQKSLKFRLPDAETGTVGGRNHPCRRLGLIRANPTERRGRKVTGLRDLGPTTAGLPVGPHCRCKPAGIGRRWAFALSRPPGAQVSAPAIPLGCAPPFRNLVCEGETMEKIVSGSRIHDAMGFLYSLTLAGLGIAGDDRHRLPHPGTGGLVQRLAGPAVVPAPGVCVPGPDRVAHRWSWPPATRSAGNGSNGAAASSRSTSSSHLARSLRRRALMYGTL